MDAKEICNVVWSSDKDACCSQEVCRTSVAQSAAGDWEARGASPVVPRSGGVGNAAVRRSTCEMTTSSLLGYWPHSAMVEPESPTRASLNCCRGSDAVCVSARQKHVMPEPETE